MMQTTITFINVPCFFGASLPDAYESADAIDSAALRVEERGRLQINLPEPNVDCRCLRKQAACDFAASARSLLVPLPNA